MITLYDAARCPYCARVRIVLAEKRVPFEAGGEYGQEGEIEIRQIFELEEFGDSPAIERARELGQELAQKKE